MERSAVEAEEAEKRTVDEKKIAARGTDEAAGQQTPGSPTEPETGKKPDHATVAGVKPGSSGFLNAGRMSYARKAVSLLWRLIRYVKYGTPGMDADKALLCVGGSNSKYQSKFYSTLGQSPKAAKERPYDLIEFWATRMGLPEPDVQRYTNMARHVQPTPDASEDGDVVMPGVVPLLPTLPDVGKRTLATAGEDAQEELDKWEKEAANLVAVRDVWDAKDAAVSWLGGKASGLVSGLTNLVTRGASSAREDDNVDGEEILPATDSASRRACSNHEIKKEMFGRVMKYEGKVLMNIAQKENLVQKLLLILTYESSRGATATEASAFMDGGGRYRSSVAGGAAKAGVREKQPKQESAKMKHRFRMKSDARPSSSLAPLRTEALAGFRRGEGISTACEQRTRALKHEPQLGRFKWRRTALGTGT